jgi:hypothetical protein
MRIAVVGDVHGHLALLYAILGRWQRETGRHIDLVLQVGDLGAFPPASRIDTATRWHAERDPEELGFADFGGDDPPATLLDPRPTLLFIPGNHEDHGYLELLAGRAPPNEPTYAVSGDGRIAALRSGRIWTFEAGGESVRIGGVSGVAGRRRKQHQHPRLHLQEDEALALASRSPGAFDLFISHERPAGIDARLRHDLGGSDALRVLIDEAQPRLAFFGHYEKAGEWSIGRTRVFGLAGCGYVTRDEWPVKPDAVVIVDWDDAEPRVEWLRTEWLARSTRANWRHWGRAGG